MRLFIFGFGYSASALTRRLSHRGWEVAGAARSAESRRTAREAGAAAIDSADAEALRRAVACADFVLIAAPPTAKGCPGLTVLGEALGATPPNGIGYLSTTGVYGDLKGGWAFEDRPPAPQSPEAVRRLKAETAWRTLGESLSRPVAIFRLPGIYGPRRSVFDRLRAGTARRWTKKAQVFSRIHVDDLAAGLELGLERGSARTYNLCDDEPASSAEVMAYAARLLDLPAPPEEPFDPEGLSPAGRRFWSESRRVSNARAKAELGWRPAHPTYREGLRAILAAESGA